MIKFPGSGGPTSKERPGPRGGTDANAPGLPPGVTVDVTPGTETVPVKGRSTTTASPNAPAVPAYLRYPVTYRPPAWGSADRQEQQISTMPLLYRAQTSGDLREAYWNDPDSRAIIEAAARVFYRDYPNYSDQWAKNFWQKDILSASINPGSPAPWQALQMIFSGQMRATESPNGSGTGSSYSSYGGGGYGGGGGGGGGSVSLTNPTSARGLLMQTMQSVLGRNPTNDEYKTFLQVLNEAEMANPQTASFEDGMAVGSGGVDPGVLALEFAQDQEDFTERQGDRYFRTFMQALAGGV